MLHVRKEDIAQVAVVPCEGGTFGIAYVTLNGTRGTEQIGSRQQADEVVCNIARLIDEEAPSTCPPDLASS